MNVPSLGEAVPKQGNTISRALGKGMLRLFGWRIQGELPNLKKLIIIVAPHTSNWDFYFGMATVFALGIRISWMGKHTLFKPPFGGFFYWLGGLPIDRKASQGMVNQTIDAFKRHKQLFIGLAPEGTRKQVKQWKTGFYHIAHGANVPITLAFFDYANQVVGIGPMLQPTGDLETDMESIQSFYKDIVGKKTRPSIS